MINVIEKIKENKKISIAAIVALSLIGSTIGYIQIKSYLFEKSLKQILTQFQESKQLYSYSDVDCGYSFKYNMSCEVNDLVFSERTPLGVKSIEIFNPEALIEKNNLFANQTGNFNKPGSKWEHKIVVSGITLNKKNLFEIPIQQYTANIANTYGANSEKYLSKILNKEFNGDVVITLLSSSSTDKLGILNSSENINISINNTNVFGEIKYSLSSDFIKNIGLNKANPIQSLSGATLLSIKAGFDSSSRTIMRDLVQALFQIEHPSASSKDVTIKLNETVNEFSTDIDNIFINANEDVKESIKTRSSEIINGKSSEITIILENEKKKDVLSMFQSLSDTINNKSISSLKDFSIHIK